MMETIKLLVNKT
jgi:hypothetical protein